MIDSVPSQTNNHGEASCAARGMPPCDGQRQNLRLQGGPVQRACPRAAPPAGVCLRMGKVAAAAVACVGVPRRSVPEEARQSMWHATAGRALTLCVGVPGNGLLCRADQLQRPHKLAVSLPLPLAVRGAGVSRSIRGAGCSGIHCTCPEAAASPACAPLGAPSTLATTLARV